MIVREQRVLTWVALVGSEVLPRRTRVIRSADHDHRWAAVVEVAILGASPLRLGRCIRDHRSRSDGRQVEGIFVRFGHFHFLVSSGGSLERRFRRNGVGTVSVPVRHRRDAYERA